MRWLADFAYLLVGLAYLPVALYHALIANKNRRGWGQRFGAVPTFDPKLPRIWIHAVSLGEVNATPRLVAELRERLPESDIVLSTTTDTGFARAVQLYGADRVFRFPLDFSLVVARVLRRIRPTIIVLVELEVWFNLVRMADRRSIPVAVVNGRLTEHSARRLHRLGRFAKAMFRRLAWVGTQDETIAARFCSLGVPPDRIEVTASLKWDTAQLTDRVDGADLLAAALGLDGSRRVWVCGSTGPGEEKILLDAYRLLIQGRAARSRERQRADTHRVATAPPSDRAATCAEKCESTAPVLVLVPRKPERFEEVARLIADAGFSCIRRSARPDGTKGSALPDNGVVLGDTIGELRKFYSPADVVFVGRSLIPLGGSDPMEAAALGKAIVVGPHMENFESPVDLLRAAGAIRIVESAHELPLVIGGFLADASARDLSGAAARDVVLRNQGATKRTVDGIVELVTSLGKTGRMNPQT